MPTVSSYLDQIFREPKFLVCDEGFCNFEFVAATILEYASPRCQHLLAPVRTETASDLTALPSSALIPPESGKPTFASASEVVEAAGGVSAVIDLISDVWNGSEPINYHAQITLGTPARSYYIDLDTGSSLLWLQSALNPSDTAPNGQRVYRPSESTTSKDLHTTTSVTYGDGTSLLASLFTDTMAIGGLVALQQLLGAASTGSIRTTFLGGKSNGLLGLSLSAANKNLVQNLKAQGVIKYASIALVGPRNDPKLAREIDRKRTLLPRGQLVVGAVDRRFYTGQIAWCPIVGGERWVVKLDQVRINGRVVFRDQLALIDTGTAYIVTSPTVYAEVKSAISGAEDIRGRKESRMFSFPEASLRSVEFVFGGRSMELKKQDFGLGGIRDEKTTRMASSIVSLPGEKGVEVFRGMENMWIIGGIFLDNVVTVFDYEARKVGFATIAED